MIKIISTKRYNELLEKSTKCKEVLDILDDRDSMIDEITTELEEQQKEYAELLKNLQDDLKNTRDSLEKLQAVEAGENSVKLTISDDLQTVTPIIRYKTDIIEKLIELHYIDDGIVEKSGKIGVQLALVTVAKDAILQILEDFQEEPDEI